MLRWKIMEPLELAILYCYFPTIDIFLWQIKFRHGLPPGDGVLYYPGEAFSTNEPVASLRLERILSGLQVEYLFLSPQNIANYSQQMCILTNYLFQYKYFWYIPVLFIYNLHDLHLFLSYGLSSSIFMAWAVISCCK